MRGLRQDLRLTRGTNLLDGEPSWVIFDPLRHRYFQIGRNAFQILAVWQSTSAAKLAELVQRQFGRPVTNGEISSIEHFLVQNNLADITGDNAGEALKAQRDARRQSWPSRLAHNYLFFRIPLVRPDGFLRSTLAVVSPFFSVYAVWVFMLLGLTGLYFVSRQWEQFSTTLMNFLSLDGAVLFAVTLVFVKSVHELAHGYMAVRYGVRVPVMGVAFLVLLPVLYTDVSDAWRLISRRQRLLIDAAGIIAELSLAAVATFLWVFLPDGGLRTAAFFIATTSWILSLLINLNPLMRFDGYFILADALGISNLQPRAFNLARWLMREILFDLKAQPPEAVMKRQAVWLAIYGWAVWLYRFGLFLGIALLIYYATFKVLGVILFVAEIAYFIVIPIMKEFRAWWQLRSDIVQRKRSLVLPVVALTLGLLACLPLDRHVNMAAVLSAGAEFKVYSPFPAQLTQVHVSAGQTVKKGDILYELEAPGKTFELEQAGRRASLLQARLDRKTSDRDDLSQSLVLEQQLAGERQHMAGLKAELNSLKLTAPFDGQLVDVDPSARRGLWVDEDTRLGMLISRDSSEFRGFIEEQDLRRLAPGGTGYFIPDNLSVGKIPVYVVTVARVATDDLKTLALASVFGGPIAVEQDSKKRLKAVRAVYPVVLRSRQALDVGQIVRGKVTVEAKPESFAAGVVRKVLSVLIREGGV